MNERLVTILIVVMFMSLLIFLCFNDVDIKHCFISPSSVCMHTFLAVYAYTLFLLAKCNDYLHFLVFFSEFLQDKAHDLIIIQHELLMVRGVTVDSVDISFMLH